MSAPVLKNEQDCVGCLACLSVCPNDAIVMKDCDFGVKIPYINREKCIGCGKCERVCQYQIPPQTSPKKAFVAINKDQRLLEKSASGGVFSAFAKLVLSRGGVVFGASLTVNDNGIRVNHECVDKIEDLPKILGSKYVQSDCSGVYPIAKQILKEGKTVLFGGTSCQVKALYAYLQGCDTSNLYTVDLVCHGVPSIHFLNEYVEYLESKYKGKVKTLSFRTKTVGKIKFELSFSVERKLQGKTIDIVIPLKKSAYYRMFLGAESYQQACYKCDYASINKPADITAGDYFEVRDDYPELFAGQDAIKIDRGVSSMIVHSEKGYELLREANGLLECTEVDINKVVKSHSQLQKPSSYKNRPKLLQIYESKGFYGIQRFYRNNDIFDWKENISKFIGKNNIKKIKCFLKQLFFKCVH